MAAKNIRANVSSMIPNFGSVAGGTVITITGTNFRANDLSVTIGGRTVAAKINSTTSLTFTTPAHTAGNVAVSVNTSDGVRHNVSGGFTYAIVSSPDLPDRLPARQRPRSMLVDETISMAREQREAEQEGHRNRLGARVNAREHSTEAPKQAATGEEYQNSNISKHPDPMFDSQRFDGTDSNLNPAPDLNTEARLKYDNERREQEKEKQNRLQNVLGMGKAPKFSPRPGGF